MDLLYLRIYAMLVFEIFIFAILQVPINFDGEPISFLIVLRVGVLVYFPQIRIDATPVKTRRWGRSSTFFFLFLLSLNFVAVQGGKLFTRGFPDPVPIGGHALP